MKLTLNPEYARNHLFVTVLMAGLAAWFAFDGLVRYPSTPARDLYAKIEGAQPPEAMSDAQLESFKDQKTKTQHGFAVLSFAAAAIVGLRLLKSAKFRLEFDEEGFSYAGKRVSYAQVTSVDVSQWEKKSIAKVHFNGGFAKIDAWHHRGAKEFLEKLRTPVDAERKI